MKLFCKRSICLLLALVLCAGLLPAITLGASAEVLSERQQAVIAVAWAYFDKGHSVQYDGATINKNINRGDLGKTRSTNETAPEGATPNETMFTVCSDYPYQVYYEAFRYRLKGNAGNCWTGGLLNVGTPKDTKSNPKMSICHWEKEATPAVAIEDAIEEIIAALQPGDVFTMFRAGGTGHTELYVGDVLGDGKGYFLHSDGARISVDTKKDTREYKSKDDPEVDERFGVAVRAKGNGGTILLAEAAPSIRNLAKKTGSSEIVKLNVLRPLVDMTDSDYPITPATKYRMSHPRLAIDRTLNKTRFQSAYTGETVTMTLKLSNSSKESYSVPVTEKVPAGATVKKPFEGTTVADGTMKWDVQLGAGETKTFTCEYEITAAFGGEVIFEGSSVGDIPSNSIPIQVGGKKLTEEEKAKIANPEQFKSLLNSERPKSDELGDFIYQKVLGLNVHLPSYATVVKKFVKETKTPHDVLTHVFAEKKDVAAADMTAYRMLVPTLWWGRDVWAQYGHLRCSDPRDMHLEPGDVIVRSDSISGTKNEQLVYLGGGKYLFRDGVNYTTKEEPEFVACLISDIFYVLRPTLAYEDVHTLPALAASGNDKKLKFTDVKESDWFFPYVDELVADGTVNGMTETTFVPNGTLTYGQALKLIALGIGEKEPAKSGSHWASGYLTLAKEKKWLDGDVDLNGAITRLALCKIAAKAKNITSQPASNPFSDTKDLDVLALYKAGVINGMTEKTFQPDGLLTRAQISKIICMLRQAK